MTLVHGIESVGIRMDETMVTTEVSQVLTEDAQTTISEDAGATIVEPQPEPEIVPDYPVPEPDPFPWYGLDIETKPLDEHETQEVDCDCGCIHCEEGTLTIGDVYHSGGLLSLLSPVLLIVLIAAMLSR